VRTITLAVTLPLRRPVADFTDDLRRVVKLRGTCPE